MTLQAIKYGAAANDGTGDSLREAMRKTQANFEFLDQSKADAQATAQAIAQKADAQATAQAIAQKADAQATALALQSKVTAEAGKSLMTDAEHQKLSGIAAGAQVNAPTNLALGAATANAREITSSTGGSVTLPAATSSTAGLMTAAESTKLGTVATNASANSSDAFLLNRANHSGTQPLSTITGTGTAAAMNVLGAGGIIERGSNASGEYVKYADGTLICSYYRLANATLPPGHAFDPGMDFAAAFWGNFVCAFHVAMYTGPNGTGSVIYSLMYNYGAVTGGYSCLNTGVLPSVSFPGFAVGGNAANSLFIKAFAVGRWK